MRRHTGPNSLSAEVSISVDIRAESSISIVEYVADANDP